MKNHFINSIVCVMIFVLGCICYDIQAKQKSIITVDIVRIIKQTAEGFAKTQMNEDQLQKRISAFKSDLDSSLKEFAKERKSLVLPAHLVHGDVVDMTEAFISYHNGSSEKTGSTVKGATS